MNEQMNITVAGTGYVGLVTGVCLAELGHNVTCVDIDEKKIEKMRQGISPIYEPGLEKLMIENRSSITYTTDYHTAYCTPDVIIIGVGTPEKKDGSANLQYVYSVVDQILEVITKDCIIVVKSTVPIGTNDKIEEYICSKCKPDIKLEVASNPEFLSQGTAVNDTLNASRIVIGVESNNAKEQLTKMYKEMNCPILVMNRRSAEMVKYASNDFLALKISYVNEIANLCEIVNADISDVTRGMGLDQRIGEKFLKAGIGYGGSCFPKDTKALNWFATFNDRELKTVKAAIEVNEQQKLRLIKKARKYYTSFKGIKVAVLGLTFKPGTDDLREAPSLVNIPILLDDGAYIRAWDPVGTKNFQALYPNEIEYVETIQDALLDADICFIFTEWKEVKELEINTFNSMKTPIVLDGRNCFDPKKMSDYSIMYECIGRRNSIDV